MVTRLIGFFVLIFGHLLPAQAQNISPWTETVVNVRDIQASSALFLKLGQWRIVSEDAMTEGEFRYWKLPNNSTGRYRLICAPKARSGCIRFIQINGTDKQMPIRAALRPWDTGGIFSTMVRSDNVEQLYRDALELGWWAESPPIRFQFGSSDLRNVVLRGPDGVNLAVYERISPSFTAFPLGRISQGFNSMRMVRDKNIARDFYRYKLGFGILFDADSDFPDPAFSNLSIPLNYTPKIKRIATALHPTPGETGRVEVMQISGFTGRDVSGQATLPNLGIISVRYPVDDLTRYRKQLESKSVSIEYSAKRVPIGGLGVINLVAVRDPDGSITEFYETVQE